MNDRQDYHSLVDMYKGGAQVVKKLGISGMFLQIGIIGFVTGWKHLEIDYYTIAAPILFFLSIYFFIKDFLTLHRIEVNVAQIILDGVALEKKNTGLGRLFHNILQCFNFTDILVKRSLLNSMAFGCLGYLIAQFISDITPGLVISRWIFSLFIWVPSVLVCKIYYDSLKTLYQAKEQTFVK